ARLVWRGHSPGRRPHHAAGAESRHVAGCGAAARRSRSARLDDRGTADRGRDRDGVRAAGELSVDTVRLPEAGRWRSLVDFYLTTMRTAIAAQLQYRVAQYFYMLGMIAEPVVYLVVWTTIAEQQGGSVNGISAGEFAAYYIV